MGFLFSHVVFSPHLILNFTLIFHWEVDIFVGNWIIEQRLVKGRKGKGVSTGVSLIVFTNKGSLSRFCACQPKSNTKCTRPENVLNLFVRTQIAGFRKKDFP